MLVAGVQYDFPPYEFIGEDGQVTGFHIALIRALAAEWGIDVEFVPVTPSDRLQKLEAGIVDIVPLEAGSIDFLVEGEALSISHIYQQDRVGLLVQNGSGVPITSTEEIGSFDGSVVAIVTGSGVDRQLNDSNSLSIDGFSLAPLPFREYGPMLSALRAGQVDAAIGPARYLEYAAGQTARSTQSGLTTELTVVETRVDDEQFVFALFRGDSYFRGLVDSTLQQFGADGTLLALSAQWLSTDNGALEGELTNAHIGDWPYTFADSPVDVLPTDFAPATSFIERDSLIIGIPYDLPSFGSVSDEGEVVGFAADMAHALAQRLLGDSAAVELVPVTAQTRLPLLATGAVDLVIAPTTPNWPDEVDVDFSTPFFWDSQSLLVQSTILLSDFADLEGQNIAVISGSRASTIIPALAETADIQIFILPFQEYSSAFQSLLAGQVVAVAGPNAALTSVAAETTGTAELLKTVELGLADEPYSIALHEGDSHARILVNDSLREMEADGTYETLYRRWFDDDPGLISQGETDQTLVTDETQSTVAVVLATPTPLPTELPTSTPRSTATPLPTLTPTVSPVVVATTSGAIPTAERTVPSTPTSTLLPAVTPATVSTVIPTVAQSTPTAPQRIHIVQAGDHLTALAVRYYGQQSFFQLIYDTNREIIGDNPNFLTVGIRLVIPPVP